MVGLECVINRTGHYYEGRSIQSKIAIDNLEVAEKAFIKGGITVVECADRFSVNYKTLYSRLRASGDAIARPRVVRSLVEKENAVALCKRIGAKKAAQYSGIPLGSLNLWVKKSNARLLK